MVGVEIIGSPKMIVKIPSKFIQQGWNDDRLREVYINTDEIAMFEVYKYVQNVYDRELKAHTDELEIVCQVVMNLKGNLSVPLIMSMNETLFEEFILWTNKSLAFANIGKE